MSETVIILGASPNPDRYAYKAQRALLENGHTPVPVNPKYDQIDGIRCYPDLMSVREAVDTVTVYVGSGVLDSMTGDILSIKPRRVIFNPGTESDEIADRLAAGGINVQNACTLVLLATSQFTV